MDYQGPGSPMAFLSNKHDTSGFLKIESNCCFMLAMRNLEDTRGVRKMVTQQLSRDAAAISRMFVAYCATRLQFAHPSAGRKD